METRTAAYLHNIIGLEHETWSAVNHETFLQSEGMGGSQFRTSCNGFCIHQRTRHIDLHYRGSIGQTSCLHHQVLQCQIGGPGIFTWLLHLSLNGDIAAIDEVSLRGDE